MSKTNGHLLLQDLIIIAFSIGLAIYLERTEILLYTLSATKELEIIGSFVAGMFFTSVFTTVPAIVTLGELSQVNSILSTALFGALGAVIGDLIIFRFIRDRFSDHVLEIAREYGLTKRFKKVLRSNVLRRSSFLIGGLIIASPFPDELGISILGMSKMKSDVFTVVSFTFNFLGIMAIGLAARALM